MHISGINYVGNGRGRKVLFSKEVNNMENWNMKRAYRKEMREERDDALWFEAL